MTHSWCTTENHGSIIAVILEGIILIFNSTVCECFHAVLGAWKPQSENSLVSYDNNFNILIFVLIIIFVCKLNYIFAEIVEDK